MSIDSPSLTTIGHFEKFSISDPHERPAFSCFQTSIHAGTQSYRNGYQFLNWILRNPKDFAHFHLSDLRDLIAFQEAIVLSVGLIEPNFSKMRLELL